jgi:hypothetical protein
MEAPPVAPPRAGRAVLAGSAVGLLVLAVLVLGVVLRNRPPDEPVAEPPTTAAPAPDTGPTPPGPTPARVPDPPVVDQVVPVESGGIMLWWQDPAPTPAMLYVFQVQVDGGAFTNPEQIGKKEDGTFRANQEIVEITRKGARPEKVDARAHEYCVVVRRIDKDRHVDTEHPDGAAAGGEDLPRHDLALLPDAPAA